LSDEELDELGQRLTTTVVDSRRRSSGTRRNVDEFESLPRQQPAATKPAGGTAHYAGRGSVRVVVITPNTLRAATGAPTSCM
jgi:hypothetical protein